MTPEQNPLEQGAISRARFVIRGKYGSDAVPVYVGLICELIALAERAPAEAAKFEKTYCAQCGGEFGAGNEGFSACAQHTRKHTPGPWGLGSIGKDTRGIVAGPRGIGVSMGMNYEEALANARLMAAAPDLLEALQLAVRQNSHDMQLTGEELRKCEAAIARATHQE